MERLAAQRAMPIFPELRPILEEAFELAEPGAEYVVGGNYRVAALGECGWMNCNLCTQFERLIRRAGLKPWPRLMHSLRASRETELVALLAEERYGPKGPPIDTTFAEIEQFGHRAGRMVGRAVDERLTARHTEHFQEACCPTCGAAGEADALEKKKTRPLQTPDGTIPLIEPAFHCPRCNRDFFSLNGSRCGLTADRTVRWF